LLDGVQAKSLVLYRRGVRVVSDQTAQRIAAKIPDARLVLLEGSEGLPFAGDAESALTVIDAFVPSRASTVHPRPSIDAATLSRAINTTVILFADIVDSTALTESMGDAAFRERASPLDVSLREIITSAGGTAIDGKLLGDGVLATFPSASQAIDAALRCAYAGDHQSLSLHVGIHAGDVIREANNVYGGAVNIASRISALSAPGEVLVSDVVRGLARTSAGVTFEDRGEHALKGVADTQRVFAVHQVK
jgi:class 3 adenylate cyclase